MTDKRADLAGLRIGNHNDVEKILPRNYRPVRASQGSDEGFRRPVGKADLFAEFEPIPGTCFQ